MESELSKTFVLRQLLSSLRAASSSFCVPLFKLIKSFWGLRVMASTLSLCLVFESRAKAVEGAIDSATFSTSYCLFISLLSNLHIPVLARKSDGVANSCRAVHMV